MLEQKKILMESILLAEVAKGVPADRRTGFIDTAGHKGKKKKSDSATNDLIHKES